MITIQPMCPEHLDGMAELEQMCFSMPWSRAMLADELFNEYAVYYVAESGERVAGYIGAHMFLDEGHITNLAVSPDLRRQGIAGGLIDKLMRIAVKSEIKHMSLEVRESNAAAISLYLNKGFKVVGKRPGYYSGPKEDALLMTAEL
ncbi:MAG: ribosomal protein S18-alanine N-acetyltransferase [Oscillospiraceae bacterium]|jgi:ribosomal-protein-alanine N-acetyltransferase|nr:ribosomal protein S18-alanine N-acetyltransferase [Oscillospiraceae bacterium]